MAETNSIAKNIYLFFKPSEPILKGSPRNRYCAPKNSWAQM